MSVPVVGDDGLISEVHPLTSLLGCLPIEVGTLKKHTVVHSCLDVLQPYLAVGSEKGYVWVVDLHSSKLLRELTDLKGSMVTALKLSSTQDYIAYGTTEGLLRVESITKPLAKRYTIRERDGQPLSALAWSWDGRQLYGGYSSGRLLKFHFQFESGVLESTPLLDCGSQVVQLSVWGTNLLISTLARSLLMDADSGRLTQVGTKDRKSGVFGGSFSLSGDKAYLARPGLRVWTADNKGKVLQTAKFRDVFVTSKHLPTIQVQSWPAPAIHFSESWQFSLLHPWLDGFVVTHQDKTLWVLDPETMAVAGVLSLDHRITSVVPCGSHLYLLCGGVASPLVRLEIQPKFKNTSILNPDAMALLLSDLAGDDGGRGEENGGHSTREGESEDSERGSRGGAHDEPCSVDETQVDATGDGPRRAQVDATGDGPRRAQVDNDATGDGPRQVQVDNDATGDGPRQAQVDSDVTGDGPRQVQVDNDATGDGPRQVQVDNDATGDGPRQAQEDNDATGDGPRHLYSDTAELIIGNVKVEFKEVAEMLKPALGKLSDLLLHPKGLRKEDIDKQREEIELKSKEDTSGERNSGTSTPVEQHFDLRDVLRGKWVSMKLGETTFSPKLGRHGEPSPVTPVSLSLESVDPLEHERRLRMSKAGGEDDDVVSGKTQRKKRKRKSKKATMSSRSSSANTSMECLDQLEEDTAMPTPPEGTTPIPLTEPVSIVEEHELIASGKANTRLEDMVESGGLANRVETAALEPPAAVSAPFEYVSQSIEDAIDKLLMDEVPPQSPSDVTLVEEQLRSPESERRRTLVGNEQPTSGGDVSWDDPLYLSEKADSDRDRVRAEADRGGERNIQCDYDEKQSALENEEDNLELSGSMSSVDTIPSHKLYPAPVPHPLAEDSDSSHDEGNELVVSDYYKLCGTLVQKSTQKMESQRVVRERVDSQRMSSREESARKSQEIGSDIWVPTHHPSRHPLQSMCMSDQVLWLIDNRGSVFYTTTESKGKDWQMMKRLMHQIASSPSGKVVWGVYNQNAYVRLGVSSWKNVTRSTFLSKSIKQLAVDENGVWAVKTEGQVMFRKGVSEIDPEGKVWQEVGYAAGFSFIACCDEVVWVLSTSGKVFIRDGITPSFPSGKAWTEVKAPKLAAVTITTSGVVWGISHDSSLGFRCGVTKARPTGKGPWWEVTISALTHPTSPYNSLWQVMTSEGSQLLASMSSFITSLPSQQKLLAVTASAKTGVCVLEMGSKLHACWRSATGYHYTPGCKDGVFQLINWTMMAGGGTGFWLVRDDGELYCLTAEEKLQRVECAATVDLLTASPTVLWVVARHHVWSRQGMSAEVPEGISWDYIELSTQLHERKLRHVVCGKRAVWAIDSTGVPHFRFGVHAREPGTGMSPAWVPVDDNPHPLIQITISTDDGLVWACDEHYTVYVRTGVTQDFPVGMGWEAVPNEQVKELCANYSKVYALTPNGDLICRYGICEGNAAGNYWRRMPGKYSHLAIGPSGNLWTLDKKGQVWRQESKALAVSQQPESNEDDLEMSVEMDPSWEVV